jgi:hypothetical protein
MAGYQSSFMPPAQLREPTRMPVVPAERVRRPSLPDKPKPPVEIPDFLPIVRAARERTPEAIAALPAPARARALLESVAESHDVSVGDILGPRRQRNLVAARREVTARIAIACPSWSLPRIGKFLNRDHTTCLWHLRKLGVVRG